MIFNLFYLSLSQVEGQFGSRPVPDGRRFMGDFLWDLFRGIYRGLLGSNGILAGVEWNLTGINEIYCDFHENVQWELMGF